MTSSPDAARRFGTDSGSSLMLWPAAILIVLLLSSIAVDFSIVMMGRRELGWAAQAAVNDAATYGLDTEHLEATGEYRLDPDRVAEAVLNSLSARGLLAADGDYDIELIERPHVDVRDKTVVVTLTGRVRYLFADGFPGLPDTEVVTVAASATAEEEAIP